MNQNTASTIAAIQSVSKEEAMFRFPTEIPANSFEAFLFGIVAGRQIMGEMLVNSIPALVRISERGDTTTDLDTAVATLMTAATLFEKRTNSLIEAAQVVGEGNPKLIDTMSQMGFGAAAGAKNSMSH